MRQWFKSVLAGIRKFAKAQPPARKPRQARLGVRTLEERQLLSGSPLLALAPRPVLAGVTQQSYAPQVQILGNGVGSQTAPSSPQTLRVLPTVVAGHGEVFGLNADGTLWMEKDNSPVAQVIAWNVQDFKVGTSHDNVPYPNPGTILGTIGFSVKPLHYSSDEVWYTDKATGYLKGYEVFSGHYIDTGARFASYQAGNDAVFGTGFNGHLYAYNLFNRVQPNRSAWSDLGNGNGGITSFSVGTDASGHNEIWALDANSSIWRVNEHFANNTDWWDTFTGSASQSYAYSKAFNTGAYVHSITAGHSDVFAIGLDGVLYRGDDQNHWSAPRDGHGQVLPNVQSISVGLTPGGSEDAWVLDGNHQLYYYGSNLGPQGGGGGWQDLHLRFLTVSAGQHGFGSSGIAFGVGLDSVFYEISSNGTWIIPPLLLGTKFSPVNIPFGNLTVGSGANGDEVWVYGTNGNLYVENHSFDGSPYWANTAYQFNSWMG